MAGLLDFLLDPQAYAGVNGGLLGGLPYGAVPQSSPTDAGVQQPFADRWSPVAGGINSGAFDPQGRNYNPVMLAPFGQPQQMASAGQQLPQGVTPPAPQEPLNPGQPGSPGLLAGRGNPLITPGLELPPAAQPTVGQQPGAMPSALGNMPVPSNPLAGLFGGGQSGQGGPSAGGQSGLPGGPSQQSPGIGDRLNAGLMGFAHSGGPLPALANLIGGIATGQRQDPEGYGRDQLQQQQLSAYKAILGAGGTQAQALAAATNPEVFKAIAPELFGSPKVVQTGEDMFGGKNFMLQQGNKFSPIPGQGGAAGAPAGQAGMLAPGATGVDSSLVGPDYLKQFSPEVQAAVKSYISGESMPTGNPRKGFTQTIKMIAQKYGADIGMPADDASFAQRRQLRNQLASGGASSLGGQVNAGNTAIGHLADMSDAALKLNNIGTAGYGAVPFSANIAHGVNEIGNTKGNNAPAVNAFNDIRQRYVEEITRFYSGGPGAQAERERALSTFDAAKTPKELASAIAAEGELMHSKLSAIQEQVKSVLGEQGLEKFPIVKPKSEDALKRIDGNVRKLNGEAPSSAASQQTPAPAPTVGTVQKGYRFKGGNPADPASWDKVQ